MQNTKPPRWITRFTSKWNGRAFQIEYYDGMTTSRFNCPMLFDLFKGNVVTPKVQEACDNERIPWEIETLTVKQAADDVRKICKRSPRWHIRTGEIQKQLSKEYLTNEQLLVEVPRAIENMETA